MTEVVTGSPPAAGPRWSSRPYTGTDAGAVLELFTEPDFYFRTAQPDTRSERELLDLLDGETRLLFGDGALLGLYAVDEVGSPHGCHYLLHLRLRASVPLSSWRAAYAEVVAGLRWRREVVRLTLAVGEFDRRGLDLARSLGLLEEGTLANVVLHEGRRYGHVYFAQIWTPS